MKNLRTVNGSVKMYYGDNYYSTKDAYTDEIKDLGVSRIEFSKIVNDFNLAVRDLIIEEGFEWNMPFNFGQLSVYKFKPKIKKRSNNPNLLSLPINPRATAKLWREKPELKNVKYVYFMNDKTDGYICSAFYTKSNYSLRFIKNLHYVMFTPVTRFNKSINKAIQEKDSHLKYFIFERLNLE